MRAHSNTKQKSSFTFEHTLELQEQLQAGTVGLFSHPTYQAKKTLPASLLGVAEADLSKKYKNTWYVKEIALYQAQIEVVAQEFLRLFLGPRQPKTRIVMDADGRVFIASKEIEGATLLPPERGFTHEQKLALNTAIKNGTMTGIGELPTLALLLNEVDFKHHNLRFHIGKALTKFDGDRCFAHLQGDWEATPITEFTISLLPFPGDYNPNHWFGALLGGKPLVPSILDRDLCNTPCVRAEINNALLKAAILPESLIKNFIDSYIANPIMAQDIYAEFIDRRNQMSRAVIQNEDFRNYLASDQAQVELNAYIDYLETFKTTSKHLIFQKLDHPMEQIRLQFDQLRNTAFPKKNHIRKNQPAEDKGEPLTFEVRKEPIPTSISVSSSLPFFQLESPRSTSTSLTADLLKKEDGCSVHIKPSLTPQYSPYS